MDGETFQSLPPRKRLAYVLGMASRILGREAVRKLYGQFQPLIDNMIGQGAPVGKRVPGDDKDPRRNYWRGVWRIYDAD